MNEYDVQKTQKWNRMKESTFVVLRLVGFLCCYKVNSDLSEMIKYFSV